MTRRAHSLGVDSSAYQNCSRGTAGPTGPPCAAMSVATSTIRADSASARTRDCRLRTAIGGTRAGGPDVSRTRSALNPSIAASSAPATGGCFPVPR